MKIKITSETKQWLTLAELPYAQNIIESYKDWTKDDVEWYAQLASRIASGANVCFQILKTDFEIAGNGRIWDNYETGSGRLDIWMNVYAYSPYVGFYDFGCYISDIDNSTGENGDEIRNHMYIRAFKEV